MFLPFIRFVKLFIVIIFLNTLFIVFTLWICVCHTTVHIMVWIYNGECSVGVYIIILLLCVCMKLLSQFHCLRLWLKKNCHVFDLVSS